ncbi:MAG: SPFH domain-containing protein, partial [Kiritimatiellae bacterium]|nr:SPFH domain-containing protein [Kiritimatiellia bacterium]
MGIFSDRCEALIDPQTGKALGGEALERAKQDPKWPRCGNHVRKAARFCNKCGSPAPGGWWKCPSCKKWVGNEAQYCSHCNTPLFPEDRSVMAGGVWRKEAGLFAQRFEIGDVKRLLQDDLLVQEGTAAVIMDGGHVHGILESGRHNPDSLARRINWFGDPPPRSAVMVDAGDVALPLRVEGLRTAEHHPIEFYGEVILRFGNDKNAARAFLENALKDARHLTYGSISETLQGVVRAAVDELCVTSTLDDLVRDPGRRLRLQETMTRAIGEDVGRFGLEIVRVSSAEFTGDEYEDYAEKLGEVDIKRRGLEYAAAVRSLLNKEAMAQIKDKN